MVSMTVRGISSFILATGFFVSSPGWAGAQTRLLVRIDSGGDDLRGGNRAFMNLVRIDGTELTEQLLSRGLGNNRTSVREVTFPETVDANQIRSIRIRHDGNPRSGHPFDTYDNWDLKRLWVGLSNDDSFNVISTLYTSTRDSSVGNRIAVFTGSLRQIDLPIRAIDGEPDFIITAIRRSIRPGRTRVFIRNIGSGTGTVTTAVCSKPGSSSEIFPNITLEAGESTFEDIAVAPSLGSVVECAVSGIDSSGRPETVTANNRSSRRF